MTSLTNYDTTIYIQSRLTIMASTFYFQMVENSAIPKFKYNNANILDVSGGYDDIATTYSADKIVDIDSTTVSIFIKKLAGHIFGSTQAVGFLSNISSLSTSAQTSLEISADSINSSIDNNGTTYILVTNSSSDGYQMAKSIYDKFNSNTQRLQLQYNSQSTGTSLPISSVITNFTCSVGNANITVSTDSTGSISNIEIVSYGSAYSKNDILTFTSGNYTIYYSGITSYQAVSFNGNVFTDDIELPLEVNDIIDIATTIKSSTSQVDASGDAALVTMIVRYRIKIV